jgi:hypothetical protein
MTLAPGARLGPGEITAALGAGGRYLFRAASAKASKYFCSDGAVEWY